MADLRGGKLYICHEVDMSHDTEIFRFSSLSCLSD